MKKVASRFGRRILSVAMALCLMACGSYAEGTADFTTAMPLVDLTASSALRVGETPESIAAEGTLSQAFVYNFFLLGQKADASLGITADMLADPAAQAAYLSRTFAASQPELSGILAFEEDYPYIGVHVMASEMSDGGDAVILYGDLYQAAGPLQGLTEEQYLQVDWLDKRAVVSLLRDDAAPGGWKVQSLSFEAELMMEAAAQDYFADTMVEYMNADLGFSIQYPATFAEDTVTETAEGIAGQLKDGTASFYARRTTNSDGASLDAYVAALQQQYPTATAAVYDVSMSGRVTHQRDDGMTQVDMVIVTESWIYEAQLCYAPALAVDFALYSDYMTNSFMADELGIG